MYHKSNQGLIHTRRVALTHATGDYYVMLDSDDLLEENTLEVLFDVISRHQCDCVFFNRKRLVDDIRLGATYHISEGYTTDRRTIMRRALIEMPYSHTRIKLSY